MTPSYKTRICLVLAILLAATVPLDANSAPSASADAARPIIERPVRPSQSRSGVSASVTYASAATAAPARYTGWSIPGSDDEELASEPPLVIPAREMDVAATIRIIEDLSIMGRIIEKNVLTPYAVRPTGWRDIFAGEYLWRDMGPAALFPSLGRPKPLYVGGYGAAFFIQVDFPLLPPPDKAQEEPAPPQEDPVWTQTRRSLLEPRAVGAVPRSESAGQPYSQGKVESFRRSLIATMKHATNIQVLEPNEWLTFVVQGFGPPPASPGQDRTTGTAIPMLGAISSGRSVMTLRATKADVDAYAKGQLSQEQFEQRVQMITY